MRRSLLRIKIEKSDPRKKKEFVEKGVELDNSLESSHLCNSLLQIRVLQIYCIPSFRKKPFRYLYPLLNLKLRVK